MTNPWDSHAPDLVRDNRLMHERIAEQDREIERLRAALCDITECCEYRDGGHGIQVIEGQGHAFWSAICAAKGITHTHEPNPPPWQPIETAPKDGTRFLIINDRGVFVASWDKDGPDNCLDDYWHVWSGKFWMDLRGMEPKHWMPLPRPPVQHASDCAVNNAPALPVGPCNCGADTESGAPRGEAGDRAGPMVSPNIDCGICYGKMIEIGPNRYEHVGPCLGTGGRAELKSGAGQ